MYFCSYSMKLVEKLRAHIIGPTWIFERTADTNVSGRMAKYTPWKINMEPTHHSFRKENDLPNLHDYVP